VDIIRWARLANLKRRSLIAIFAILILIPLVGLTFLSVKLATEAVQKEVRARTLTTASVSGRFISERMTGLDKLVLSYAERPLLIEALGGGHPERYGLRAISSQTSQLRSAAEGVGTAFLADPTGRLISISPSTPSIIGADFSYRDWYKGVVRTGKPYVSEVYTSAASGNPEVVAVAAPVKAEGSAGGETIAILVAAYRTESIRAFARELGVTQGIEITLADQTGTVIAGRAVFSSDSDEMQLDPLLGAALKGQEGVVELEGEVHTLSAYTPVPEIGWAVVAEVPSDSAATAISGVRTTIFGLAAMVGIALLGALTFLARTLKVKEEREEALKMRENQTREILDAATDAYVQVDVKGCITGWNRSAERLFGWSEEEAIGVPAVGLLVASKDRDGADAVLGGLLSSAPGAADETTDSRDLQRRDGSIFPVDASAWVTETELGQSVNVFVRDTSVRRQTQEALALASERAVEASRLKSEFLANMSHEIRTPMNGVLGMTSLLLDTELTGEQHEYAETIFQSADALLTVINDILDFSKIEAGKMTIEPIDFEVRSLVEDVGELLSRAAQTKGVELINLIRPDVPTMVKGDPGRIRQVLLNLVNNAVKFTSVGEVVVSVSTIGNSSLPRLRFEVQDTGIGIAREDQSRMFDSFSQADTSSSRGFGGTGLGLAISKQLVGLMDGQIGLESEVGVGSTFWFELPVELSTSASLPVALDHSRVAGARILVVDDNRTNLSILSQTLKSWGTEPVCALSGEEAIQKIDAEVKDGQSFDLAILDLHMPGMDGLELAVLLKERVAGELKIIMLASALQTPEQAVATTIGILANLTKPVKQGVLFDTLAAVLSDERANAVRPRVTRQLLAEARSLDRKRLLVVDDNPVNQKIASRMLETMGFRVDVASDGREAVEAVAATQYALVLMDCQMPVMDGYKATAEIRRSQGYSLHLPIIAMTAGAMVEDRDRALAAGMDDYISKPFKREELESLIARTLSDSDAALPKADHLVEEGSNSPIDAKVIASLKELDDDVAGAFFTDFLRTFISDGEARIVELETLLAHDGLSPEALEIAHTLKGSCGVTGARRAAALCARFEEAATDEEARARLRELRAEFDMATAALEQMLSAV
jgi:PAS domain S-box-containing protein